MDISSTIDRVKTEEKLNIEKRIINNDVESFNTSFDDAYEWDTEAGTYVKTKTSETVANNWTSYPEFNIEENNEVTSITTIKERRLLAAQAMFKKSIRVSLKSFLIAISLSFLNLFI